MNPLETLRFALSGLAANKLRSALTTLGILIGVAAVIVLVAVGNGAQAAVANSITSLGTNVLTVSPSAGGSAGAAATKRPLTVADARALVDQQGAPDIATAVPVVSTNNASTTAGDVNYSVRQVVGTEPGYLPASNATIASGSAFTDTDVAEARKVVLLGPTTAAALFPNADPVGRQVLINNLPFTVLGVLEPKGATGFGDPDDIAVAPISTVQNTLAGYGGLNQILVTARSADVMAQAQAEIGAILNSRHNVTNPANADYRVSNPTQLLATRTEATETFTVLLAAVAAISLLVGGIGITNIMLVTVTERIREIGVRKAMGAPRRVILAQFLTEATLLGLLGGGLGVVAGLVGSRFTIYEIEPVISWPSVVLAFAVSAALGLFFGSYPANRAARLRPIEALRHE
ncbi:putative ABC transport system permease protein [Herbihabitans rhizosphaerae]|uniref:Putative ABC transport system permease protein n=1 Tax=Herbihabitans rhizosphaerae TaxID=1872711 RepID=A0A4Q7KR81_9PSEU|nr:ABC transporter permease [Herbihabitans rhizosphaerae]RZS37852.1 putative ABC transport system permease protein [Herbihabitans rhizosphaerae]